MPDFEIIEPEQLLPSALQLAQDAAAQTRAYHQCRQVREQRLADANLPPLTYAGQSNGQTLLRTPEGNLLRVGQRDSNGALLQGVADIVSSSGVVRVGGMPRVRPTQQSSTVQTIVVAILIERKDLATEETELFIKENSLPLVSLGTFEKPVYGEELTSVLGTAAFAYLDQSTTLIQFALRYSLSPTLVSNTVVLTRSRAVVLRAESNIVNADTGELFVYPSSLSAYTPSLRVAAAVSPPLYEPYSFEETAASGAVLPDGSAVFVFTEGTVQATPGSGTNFKVLFNGAAFGAARGFPTGSSEIAAKAFTTRQFMQLSQSDLAVWGLTQDSLISLSELGATQTIAEYRVSGLPSPIFYSGGFEYRLKFIRGYTDARI